jgi:hypothetical protein
MPRPVVCPHCSEELDIPPEFRGRQVRCAVCQSVFVPPVNGAEAPPPLPTPGSWDEERPSRRPAREDDLPAARRAAREDDLSPARRADRGDSTARDRDRDFLRDRWDDPPTRSLPKRGGNAWVWLLLLGFFGLCVLPCGGLFLVGAWVAFPRFEPHESPAGRFRAEFPGQPFTYTRTGDDGQTQHCTEYKRSFPPETYSVCYVDLPPKMVQKGSDRVLADAADAEATRHPGSTERSRTSGNHDGHPSLDLTLEHPDDTATIVRFVLVNRRLYTVGITGMIDADTDPRVQHFLEAFHVSAEPAGEK